MLNIIYTLRKFITPCGISPKIIESVDDVAEKVCSKMGTTGSQIPYPLMIMQDCDFHKFTQDRGIQDYLGYLSNMFLDGYTPSNELLAFIKKTNKYHDINRSVHVLVKQAFMDIYILQILQIHYGLNKQKLKGLIYSNMMYGNKINGSSITTLVISLIDTKGKMQITIDELELLLKNNKGKGNNKTPACPLHLGESRNEFIEQIWSYTQDYIIPTMQDTFKNSQFSWEKYWSGNKIKNPTE